MKTKKVVKRTSVVVAMALVILSFAFFIPPAKYFLAVCVGTVMVWGMVFSLAKSKRKMGIVAGLLFALAIQQMAFHAWRPELSGVWWPLVQFLSLQYLIVIRLGSSTE